MAEVALLLEEREDATRLSVRTKPGGVDATVLCGIWGGGGHPRAAGASLALPLAEAMAVVIPEAVRLARAVVR
jgi:nanoRNase/pAp phosphatase (c-di-AMP/oligoRNAs hydrolase)